MEEEIIENPSTLCRVCLDTGSYDLTTLMNVENEKVTIEEMLKEFSCIETNENLPSTLCTYCLAQLSESYTFMKKVQRADEYIKELFDSSMEDNMEQYFETNDKQQSGTPNFVTNLSPEDDIEDLITPILPGEFVDRPEVQIGTSNASSASSSHEPQSRPLKRPARTNKVPSIVLTEKVSSILSRAGQAGVDDLIEELSNEHPLEGEPPSKKQKSSDNNSLIITRFVLQPFIGSCNATSSSSAVSGALNPDNEDTDNATPTVNTFHTIDMAAVEVDAHSKIQAEEIDDETNIENPNRIYMCKYCPKAFSTSHHLLMHSRKSHICLFCTQSFTKVEDLHRHSKEAHTSFRCSLCDKEFSSNSNLRQHIKRVHNIDLPAFVSLLSAKRKDSAS